ncbi:hypothetical protein MUO32_20130 [Shinella sp. CPCC 101442]|nr:hypothetical protein [Shinella sp. CPCC 101442]
MLGDSAWCLTFLAGQGTSTAMAGACILASKLARKSLPEALDSYEARMQPLVTRMQAVSRKIGGTTFRRERSACACSRGSYRSCSRRSLYGSFRTGWRHRRWNLTEPPATSIAKTPARHVGDRHPTPSPSSGPQGIYPPQQSKKSALRHLPAAHFD